MWRSVIAQLGFRSKFAKRIYKGHVQWGKESIHLNIPEADFNSNHQFLEWLRKALDNKEGLWQLKAAGPRNLKLLAIVRIAGGRISYEEKRARSYQVMFRKREEDSKVSIMDDIGLLEPI